MKSLRLFWVLFLFSTPLFSLSNDAVEKQVYLYMWQHNEPPIEGVTGARIFPLYLGYDKDDLKSVRISPRSLVGPFVFDQASSLAVFRKVEYNEELKFTPIARLQDLPDATVIVQVLLPNHQSDKREYSSYPIDVSGITEGTGKAVLINLTDSTLGLQVGEQYFILSSQGTEVFEFASEMDGFALPIRIARSINDAEWVRVHEEIKIVNEQSRLFFIIYPIDIEKGIVRIETINL